MFFFLSEPIVTFIFILLVFNVVPAIYNTRTLFFILSNLVKATNIMMSTELTRIYLHSGIVNKTRVYGGSAIDDDRSILCLNTNKP